MRVAAARQSIDDAAIDQEPRLRRIARERHVSGNAGMRDGAEVDMRRQIRKPWQEEWIVHRAMTIMRHQCAAVALRMVILACWKSVVDNQERAGIATQRKTSHQGLRCRIDLARIVAMIGKTRPRRVAEGAVRERPIGESKFAGDTDLHAALEPCAVLPGDQMRRHGVEHFVGQQRSAPMLGKDVDPLDARQQIRHAIAQLLALTLAQVGTHFQQAISFGRRVA